MKTTNTLLDQSFEAENLSYFLKENCITFPQFLKSYNYGMKMRPENILLYAKIYESGNWSMLEPTENLCDNQRRFIFDLAMALTIIDEK